MHSPLGYDMREFILLLLSTAIAATSLAEIKDPVATEVWEPVPRKMVAALVDSLPTSTTEDSGLSRISKGDSIQARATSSDSPQSGQNGMSLC